MRQHDFEPLQAAIDASSSGDNEVIAAVTNKVIVVEGYTAVAAGTVTAKWKSGSVTEKSGPMSLGDKTGASPAWNPDGVLICDRGEALNLNLDGAVQVGGMITYYLKD